MINRLGTIAVVWLLTACATTDRQAPTPEPSGRSTPAAPAVQLRADWGQHFAAAKVNGTFALYDVAGARWQIYNQRRAAEPFLPASTFKVPNLLIALETGVVDGAQTAFAWDGTDRGYAPWNEDQTVAEAMRRSTVWVFQDIAKRIGEPTMRAYVNRFAFGNVDIGGGIDRFWLVGQLRVSALQQIDFWTRMLAGQLPVDAAKLDQALAMMTLEQTDHYQLLGKTGWVQVGSPEIGWMVGAVRRGEEDHVFAMNINLIEPQDRPARLLLTQTILRAEGLID